MPVADVERLLFVNRICSHCGDICSDNRHSVWLSTPYDCLQCGGIKTSIVPEDDREDFYVDTDGNRI